jgi:hypothetical protein
LVSTFTGWKPTPATDTAISQMTMTSPTDFEGHWWRSGRSSRLWRANSRSAIAVSSALGSTSMAGVPADETVAAVVRAHVAGVDVRVVGVREFHHGASLVGGRAAAPGGLGRPGPLRPEGSGDPAARPAGDVGGGGDVEGLGQPRCVLLLPSVELVELGRQPGGAAGGVEVSVAA